MCFMLIYYFSSTLIRIRQHLGVKKEHCCHTVLNRRHRLTYLPLSPLKVVAWGLHNMAKERSCRELMLQKFQVLA